MLTAFPPHLFPLLSSEEVATMARKEDEKKEVVVDDDCDDDVKSVYHHITVSKIYNAHSTRFSLSRSLRFQGSESSQGTSTSTTHTILDLCRLYTSITFSVP